MLDAKTAWQGLVWLAPEAALTLLILLVIIADLVFKRDKRPVAFLALVGTLGVLWIAAKYWDVWTAEARSPVVAFMGAFAVDLYGGFFRILFLASAAVVIVLTQPVVGRWKTGAGETYALMLSCTLGMMFMAGANDLLMMYLSLEFVSITSYILAGMRSRDRFSSEASLKYIIYGAAASGMMIYGMSFLYGMTGTLNVAEIGPALANLPIPLAPMKALLVSTLIMAGFGYKIAAAPFHMWCPDVYQGAPTPVTAFFSVGPKAAGFAMLVRFVAGVFQTAGPEGSFDWKLVMAILAVLTMAIGNFGALQQQNLKRLMAYSSIGHAGYMLLAFTVFEPASVSSVLLYLAVYVVMNLGAFSIVIALEERFGIDSVDGCRGLGWRAPWLCGLMTLFMISLTGLPPTAGFIGKLVLFGAMVESGSTFAITLVIVGVLFSVVSLYYYARVVGAMFLVKAREELPSVRLPASMYIILWGMAAATIGFGLFPTGLIEAANRAVAGILTKI